MSTEIASAFEAERMNIAVRGSRDAVTLIADTHVPAAAYDQAARHFDAQELAHLIWQIAAINAWNRIAVATRRPSATTSPEPA